MANSQYPMHMQQFAAQSALPYQQQQQQQQQFPQQQAQQQNPALSQQHNMGMQFNGLGGQQKFPQSSGFPGQQQQHGQLNGAGAGVSPAALQQMGLSPSQYQQMAQMKMAMNRGASNGAYPQQGQQGQQGQQPSFDARAALLHQQQQQNAAAMPPPRPQTAQQNFGSPTPPMANGFSGMQAGGAFGQGAGQQSPFINQGMGRPDTPHHHQPQQQQQQQQFAMPGTPHISRPPTAGPSSQIQPRPLSPSVTGALPESPLMRGAKRKASELGTPGPGSGYAGSPTQQPAVVDMKIDPAMQFTAMDTPARPSTAASQVPSTPAMMGPPPAVGGSGVSPLAGPGPFATPGPSTSPLAHRRPPTGMNGMRAPSRAGSTFMSVAGGSKPALPGNANPDVTKVTKVALAGSGTTIPPLTDEDMSNMKEWLARDEQYAKELQAMKDRMRAELRGVATRPPHWFEEDNLEDPRMRRKPKEKLSLLFPAEKRADRERKLRLWRKSRLYVPRTLSAADAKRQELLVPIRLEFDVESHRFRETFVWNMHDPIVTPEIFAQSVCDDFALPHHQHAPTIVKMINDQLADFRAHTLAPDAPTDDAHPDAFVRGKLSEADEKWWSNWRKRLRTDRGKVRIGKKSEIDPAAESVRALGRPRGTTLPLGEDDDAPVAKVPQEPEEDLRIVVNIDILVGSMNLKDQFEWDIANPSNSPEHFAEVYCSDLGLGGEFKTAVAHCIREQSQVHMKSLFVVGHPMDGTPILEEEVKQTFLPPVDTAARSFEQTSIFTPIIDYLSDGEIERTEKEREKELKRKRRQTKGKRGIALPDRDPVRTHRTPAIGFPDMDPSLASSGITAPTSSKRAAAAAASATIAVMVASENEGGGGRYSAPVNLPEKAAQPPKPTRTRGLYKPPPIPNPIENPRAQMTKTESTALAPTDRATRPPDSAGSTRLTAFHRPKDEFVAEGQHKNIIDGVWHCSNCGAPDGIAVGRRKGPNGIKSQCGPCGKYWHQHRKPRSVQYSTDRAWHERQLREMSKKGKRSRNLAIHTDLPPHNRADADGAYQPLDVGASSPQSTMSSISQQSIELPLAKKARVNGNAPVSREGARASSPPHLPPAPPPVPVTMPTNAPPAPSGGDNGAQHVSAPPYPTDGSGPGLSPLARPEWLMAALKAMQDKYPDDRFDVIQRPRVQTEQTPDDEIWRVKCFDCPGKLYKPGPAQSLDNFEVHLRNRLHRQKVAARVSGAPPPSAS